jgi:AraC-like DNA-binding protein
LNKTKGCLIANFATVPAARIVLEAKRMLAHTGLPVGTIAQTLGFEETTHFSKFFKRVADLTLGEFRLKQTES